MGSVCLPREETNDIEDRRPISVFYSGLAISALWVVNLLIVLFGWPFLLYGKYKYRKVRQDAGPADGGVRGTGKSQ